MKVTLTDIICKHCGKPAKMFWKDASNGHSETFYRDMHIKCYEIVYGQKVKTLQQLNEERKIIHSHKNKLK